jgi:predicted ATPase
MALTINRLTQREIEAMIDRVVGNKPISAGIREEIIEHTDGIPLFVEEVTKAALEAGSEVAAQRTVASVLSPSIAVRWCVSQRQNSLRRLTVSLRLVCCSVRVCRPLRNGKGCH